MDRPRRALIEEPDEVDLPYVPRRSSGFTPVRAALEPELEPEPEDVSDDEEDDEPPSRPRRAMPAAPDLPDVQRPAAAWDRPEPARPTRARPPVYSPLTPSISLPPTVSPPRTPAAPPAASPPAAQPAASLPAAKPPLISAPAVRPRPIPAPLPPPPPIPAPARPAPPPPPGYSPPPARVPPPAQVPPPAPLSAPPRPEPVYTPPPEPAYTPPPSPPAYSAPPRITFSERPQTDTATEIRLGSRTRAVGRTVEPIVIDRLVKSYGGILAVRNLSFTVDAGRITGFLGPNGAGKTTTLRILVGLVKATTGSATFGGTAYADLSRPQRTVGAVLEAHFHPGRTGRNHLRVLAATAGASDQRVDELLELVGLEADARRPAGHYSLGMRQRLALASAMVGNPDYLILDEPANGLDPEGIRWLRRILRNFTASGRAVLMSSHLLNEVQATVDEIVVINQGRLLAQMPMSQLQLGGGTTRARVSDLELARQVLRPLDAEVEVGRDEQGEFLRIHSQEVTAVGTALFGAGIVVYELITERRELEQEFFSMLEAAR